MDSLEDVYDKIGESCPFLAAEYLGIMIISGPLGDNLGIYAKTSPIHRIIWINNKIHIETQIEVCEKLLLSHFEADGVSAKIVMDVVSTTNAFRPKGILESGLFQQPGYAFEL